MFIMQFPGREKGVTVHKNNQWEIRCLNVQFSLTYSTIFHSVL